MADKPHITKEGYIAQLVRVGIWATPQNPIQYAFLEQKPFYLPNEPGWIALSAAQRAAVQQAFAMIAEVVNLTFVQVPDNQQVPGPNNPRINFYANSVELSYSGSMDAYQIGTSDAIHGADIRFNNARIAQRQANEGFADFMPFVALHEVLHAMGLSHPGNYNGQGPTYPNNAEFVEDTVQYSVMSYFAAAYTGADHTIGSVLYAARTPLLYDILALQSLYAPNMTTRAGDTVYGFNSNTGANSPFNFAVTTGPVVAIWDAGGIDTIDLSGYSGASLIDLNEGAFSDAGGLTKNIAIAFGVTIENATGGPGDDLIRGNQVANQLSGGLGNDVLEGGAGADLLDGGAGIDTLRGGIGDDDYYLDQSGDVVEENAGEGVDTVHVALAAYTLGANVERLYGTAPAGGQVLTGNALANVIVGGAGNDTIDGRAGADTLSGGLGDDLYVVDNGGDLVTELAGGGIDEIRAALASFSIAALPNVENLTGLGAIDHVLTGNSLANTIRGGDGMDLIDGGLGADMMAGGLGDDTYVIDDVGDQVIDGAGNDTIRSSINVSLEAGYGGYSGPSSGIETVILTGAAAINAIGDGFANILIGNDSANMLDGRGGADTMAGGLGDDLYLIDVGGDQVVEASGGGIDTVWSFIDYALGADLETLMLLGTAMFATGNGLDNLLIGNDLANVIDGGAGADTMDGGDGDDLYFVDHIGDIVAEFSPTSGDDEVRTALASYALTSHVERLTGTSTLGQALTGNGLGNVITGGSGDDLLDGGAGADMLRGGIGNDIYFVDDQGDDLAELAGSGTDEVRTSLAAFALGDHFENLTGTSASGQLLSGNGLVNFIFGGSGNDLLDGGAGADVLRGGLGNDIYLVDDIGENLDELAEGGVDEIQTGLAAYSLFTLGTFENLTGTSASGQILEGNGLANTIFGGTGDDLLDGGAGVDVLRGGMGNDIYVVDEIGDNIDELPGWGTDEVRTGLASYSLAALAAFENLTGTSSSGQMLIGNALSNLILGGSGNDVVDGGGGADVLRGGLGNDIYVVDDAGDNIDELPEGGVDEVRTGLAVFSLFALGTFENLTGTSSSGQILEGNGLANVIVAGSGSDLLYGGGGADTLQGGMGNDIYFVEDAGDLIVELAGEGTDEARTALASYSIAAFGNVENLTGLGNGDQSLTGNGADNIIDGGLGADTMTGGLGNDVYIVDNGGDVVVELAGEGNDEIRTSLASFSLLGLANVENLTATSNANHDFRGNASNNVITGAAGNDFLRLQDGGVDTVIGGGGNDVILFGATLNGADAVDGGTGTDQAVIQGDYSGGLTLGTNFVSIESFAILPGSDTRFGDPGTNFYDYNLTTLNANVAAGVTMVVDANRLRVGEDFTFNGSAETDGGFFIYGGGGTDTLLGGSGNDTFYFGENLQFGASDTANGGAGGIDQLGLRGNYTITFGAGQLTSIESMGLVSAQDTRFGGLGTAYNYNLTMNDGNVAAGVRMTVDAAPLRGAETLTFDGSAETDGSFRIFGGQGADTIRGSQINDLITGETGADNLWGSGGNDSFLYRTAGDSTSAARDTIHDFSSGDLINLTQIDAIAGSPANDAFTFIGSSAFTNTAGQLRAVFDAGNNVWTVQGDVNGDGVADLELIVSSDHPLVGGDFAL